MLYPEEPERRGWVSTTVQCSDGSGPMVVGGHGLFAHIDFQAMLLCAVFTFNVFASIVIVKMMSSVVKELTTMLATMFVILYSEFFRKPCWSEPMSMELYFNLVIVLAAALLFSLDAMTVAPAQPPAPADKEVAEQAVAASLVFREEAGEEKNGEMENDEEDEEQVEDDV